jgi:hypothetical protein
MKAFIRVFCLFVTVAISALSSSSASSLGCELKTSHRCHCHVVPWVLRPLVALLTSPYFNNPHILASYIILRVLVIFSRRNSCI